MSTTARSLAGLGAVVALISCGSTPRRAAKPVPPPAAPAEPVTYVDPNADDLPYWVDLSPDEGAALEALVARGSTNCIDHARLAAFYGHDPFAVDDDSGA